MVVQVLLVKEVWGDGGGSAGGGEVEVGGLRLAKVSVKVVGNGGEEAGDEAVHGSGRGVQRLVKVSESHGVCGGGVGKKDTEKGEGMKRQGGEEEETREVLKE